MFNCQLSVKEASAIGIASELHSFALLNARAIFSAFGFVHLLISVVIRDVRFANILNMRESIISSGGLPDKAKDKIVQVRVFSRLMFIIAVGGIIAGFLIPMSTISIALVLIGLGLLLFSAITAVFETPRPVKEFQPNRKVETNRRKLY